MVNNNSILTCDKQTWKIAQAMQYFDLKHPDDSEKKTKKCSADFVNTVPQ